uniref:Phorbol-ester/DAG-type domain-containing protein n=1 Tax=Fagus sylvatica TaxID=28930 RepID=A0A2N9IKR7_FAGSY
MGKIKHSCHNYPLFPDDDDFSLKILFSTEDINKSSAELPAEIQHFFHSSHSLALHAIEGNAAVNCDVCQGSWRGFTYRCKDCDFKMDVECAKLQPEIQLSIHPEHPLKLQVGDTETDSHFYCDFCNNRCYSDQGRTFHCKHCSFKIDLDCARMLLNSEQIKHVSHEHWLGLDVIQSSERKYCSACREVCDGATYCCKRCHFFLHKSCAEYPTRIKLSLHSDHPLTLGTGTTRERCNFCNLICRALTFRCDMCNFKIDFTCACMLIQFCESVTNGNDIEHYSDQHKLSFWGYGPMDDDAHCYACKKPVSFKFYYCFNCSFYLHSSCSIDLIEHYRDNYKQIQTSFHEHPLEIVYYNSNVSDDGAVCCSVCGNRCLGPTYVCFLCRFELHESCLGQVQRINQKSFHKHPLVMIENKHPLVMIENKVNYYCSATCSACGEPDLDTTFICLICKFYFDGSCLGLPKEIQHSFHPCPLTLRQETTKFTCRACGKTRTQFAFHCDRCHFYLDVECAQMFTGIFEDQKYILNPSHGHPLTLCNKEQSGDVVFCYGCSKTSSGQEIYGCVKCDFYLHRSCAASPKQIKHHFHPNHTLTLTYDDHDAWCKVSILKTLDERGEVKYLRHKHFSNSHDKQNVCCDACEKRICGPSYDCSRCNFFVHQHCLEPAEELQNPLHLRDRQIGVSRKSPFTRTVKCDACQYHCSGFYYRCDGFKSTRNKPLFNSMIEHELDFVLHVDCASLKPSVKYEGHEHLLTFLEKMHDDPKCEVCKTSYRDVSYLRCVECDYNVHFLCVPLPCTIKHKCHIDPLHLRDYFVEDDSGEYYCDACEESRDPGECVYHCAECSNYVAHLNCVLDEVCSNSQSYDEKLKSSNTVETTYGKMKGK